MDKKSPDAFRTISEVAEWLGVPTHVLRFWESRFTQVKPVKRAGGRRYYRPSDMALLGGIRKLLHEDGMTIRGVQKLLREQGVKHIAALSPPIDSDPALPSESADQAGSNVVSFGAGQEPKETIEDKAPAETAPTTAPDPISEPETVGHPDVAQTADTVQDSPTPDMEPDTSVVSEAPMAFPSSDTMDEDTPPAEVIDMAHAPADNTGTGLADTPEQDDAPVATAADPLEPVPHDGPTIAETLAVNSANGAEDSAAPDLPDVTPDEVVLSSEELSSADDDMLPVAAISATQPDTPEAQQDPQSAAPGMDLFSFADTVSTASDTPVEGAADVSDMADDSLASDTEFSATPDAPLTESGTDSLADDAPLSNVPDAAAPTAPDTPQPIEETGQSAEAASVAVEGSEARDTSDKGSTGAYKEDGLVSEEDGETKGTETTAEISGAPTAPAPQLGDISHIPMDPPEDGNPLSTPQLTTVLRAARRSGTDTHLPVLQAFADRLDALSAQMNRSGRD